MDLGSESEDAHALYDGVRLDDRRLAGIEGEAIRAIRHLVGYDPADVGSFGLQLNLPGSDLDIAIGAPAEDMAFVLATLKRRTEFVAERPTTDKTTRSVFLLTVEGFEVDVGVYIIEDFQRLILGLRDCRRGMTIEQRIIHTWDKYRLRESGAKARYADFKLEPYRAYCPGFLWLPVF